MITTSRVVCIFPTSYTDMKPPEPPHVVFSHRPRDKSNHVRGRRWGEIVPELMGIVKGIMHMTRLGLPPEECSVSRRSKNITTYRKQSPDTNNRGQDNHNHRGLPQQGNGKQENVVVTNSPSMVW